MVQFNSFMLFHDGSYVTCRFFHDSNIGTALRGVVLLPGTWRHGDTSLATVVPGFEVTCRCVRYCGWASEISFSPVELSVIPYKYDTSSTIQGGAGFLPSIGIE